ncbi:MAG TPA: hypothetical protein VFW96_03900 [Thermomicrobiales bacterium]|nr:hypothetical protein [Thermomicrobiales bacterium]
MLARQQGRGLADLAAEAGAAVALARDDPAARGQAPRLVLGALGAAAAWLATQPGAAAAPGVQAGLVAAHAVRAPDVVADGEMRHGRTSRSRRIDGDTHHVVRDLGTGPVPAVGLAPANAPEASVAAASAARPPWRRPTP